MASSSGPPEAATPVIVARDVSKTFRVPEERRHTLKERALHPRRRTRYQAFQALKNVSFAVESGEFFGIAGRNGSGKSTLLKCLAGIYGADGQIWRRGRLSTLIELGVGFNMDMAARDNVVMNGIMLGLSPREARKRYEGVIEFAELQEFKDLKLKNYSSGMQVRLAFSVAIQVDADILMVDEVLAVGDAAFQQKCFDVFNDLRDRGRTIVFVTHDMGALQRFCHRALLLERGDPVYLGDPHEVADRYLELNFGRDPQSMGDGAEERIGDGQARIVDVWLENEIGERLSNVPQHQRVTLKARVLFMVDVSRPLRQPLHLQRRAPSGCHRHHLDGQRAHRRLRSRRGGGDCRSRSTTSSLPDATRPCSSSLTGARARHDRPLRGRLLVRRDGPKALGGVVDLPVRSAVSRVGAPLGQRTRA